MTASPHPPYRVVVETSDTPMRAGDALSHLATQHDLIDHENRAGAAIAMAPAP